uniref:Uncharacterized protein n=1 Tax=Rhizophora mucronata TaxID=61149 RepID=A0A2P2NEQ1_RHIMU
MGHNIQSLRLPCNTFKFTIEFLLSSDNSMNTEKTVYN